MLLAHAVTLAEARSHVAALADGAHTSDASAEYERVLLQLDWHLRRLHPRHQPRSHRRARDLMFGIAETAIENLIEHGVERPAGRARCWSSSTLRGRMTSPDVRRERRQAQGRAQQSCCASTGSSNDSAARGLHCSETTTLDERQAFGRADRTLPPLGPGLVPPSGAGRQPADQPRTDQRSRRRACGRPCSPGSKPPSRAPRPVSLPWMS